METSPSKPAASGLPCSSLHTLNEKELERLERVLMTASPAMFAMAVSESRWKPAAHLVYLDH
jgi:hypothetical protein